MRLWFGMAACLLACSGPAREDAGHPEQDGAGPVCDRDEDCDDGLFCTGEERCAPGDSAAGSDGCVRSGSSPCGPAEGCAEESDSCLSCALDADGDGEDAIECGGTDCDDTDPLRGAGQLEVCDAAGLDEDCDPTTIGPDADADTYVRLGCCNAQPDGTMRCGSDCDDMNLNVGPGAPEICDGRDNDCVNGLDFPGEDDDGDGWADCVDLPAALRDCEDTDPEMHPGAVELCDGIDNDCDGVLNEDDDHDSYLAPDATCVGGPLETLPRTDCDDALATTHPMASEVCNGADDDCDGNVDGTEAADASCPWRVCRASACDDPVDVATGSNFTCARMESGRVFCWGSNAYGQLGDGGSHDTCPGICATGFCGPGTLFPCSCDCTSRPVPVSGLDDAIALTAGRRHACAIRSGGQVVCWGDNDRGQLGIGRTDTTRMTPTEVSGITTAVQISAGDGHTCARLTSGALRCWGGNGYGELGDGTFDPRFAPVPVMGLPGSATDVAAGENHTCAVLNDGRVTCWGYNTDGTFLGTPDRSGTTATAGGIVVDMFSPVGAGTRVDLTGIATVSGFSSGTCAVTAGRTMWCWPGVSNPFVFNGADPAYPTLDMVTQFVVGGSARCALRMPGDVWCASSGEPTPVAGISSAVDVDFRYGHGCVAVATGGVLCWGSNTAGQLGDGTRVDRTSPVTATPE